MQAIVAIEHQVRTKDRDAEEQRRRQGPSDGLLSIGLDPAIRGLRGRT